MRQYLTPDWPAPANIKAVITTRHNGTSQLPYNSFNLAMHVDDNAEHVLANRALLKKDLALPNEPYWLDQTHSTTTVLSANPIAVKSITETR